MAGERGIGNAAAFDTLADPVFDRIAGRYDLLCDLFSLGLHRLWKRRMAELIADEPWQCMLDSAAGTGDIALRMARRTGVASRSVIVADISPAMLAIARRRAGGMADRLSFRVLDAHAMPEVPDASLDLYTISLALKICDRARVLDEVMRVLRPGGRLIVLEASAIVWPWLHRLYLAYMGVCMPVIGWVATGGDASAYRYLLRGVREFPDADALAAEVTARGFETVRFELMTFGIVAIHSARKPA